jgi:hypothetical protein
VSGHHGAERVGRGHRISSALAALYDLPLAVADGYQVGSFARVQNLFDRCYDEVRGFRSPPINVLAGAEVRF